MKVESLSDRLDLQAIKECWPITNEKRNEIIERAMVRARCGDPETEDRAAKIILAADVVNLKRQQLEQKTIEAEHARKLQLIEAAVKLGLVGDGRQRVGGVGIIAPESQ